MWPLHFLIGTADFFVILRRHPSFSHKPNPKTYCTLGKQNIQFEVAKTSNFV